MNAEYVNPFLEAAALVYKDLLGVDLLRGKTSIKNSPAPAQDIAIILGVVGNVEGKVIYSLNKSTVAKIVRKLIPGIDDASIITEYKDVIGELGNMITGNALNAFMRSDNPVDVTVPMVVDIVAEKFTIKDQLTLGLNLYSPYGILEVNVALS